MQGTHSPAPSGAPFPEKSASGVAARTLDFTLPPLSAGGGAALAGSTLYFQFLHRDPTGPAGNRVARSDGLAVTLEP